ncbi:MAG: histidine kinase [Firmicutes bacterium]|nr:histidine kinase [Bacillota bacterium]
MKNYKDLPLFRQFALAFLVIVLIPTTLIGGVVYYGSMQYTKANTSQLMEKIVQSAGKQIDAMVNEYKWLSSQIGINREVQRFILLDPMDYFEQYLFGEWAQNEIALEKTIWQHEAIENMAIICDYGRSYLVANKRVDEDNIYFIDNGERIQSNEYFRKTYGDDCSLKIFKMNIFNNESNQEKEYVVFSRRIYSGVSFKAEATFAIFIPRQSLKELFQINDVDLSSICFIDNTGKMVFSSYDDVGGKQLTDIVPDLKTSGIYNFEADFMGKNQMFTIGNSKDSGWKTVLFIPTRKLYAPIYRTMQTILVLGLLVILFSAMAWWGFCNIIILPIKRLELAMQNSEVYTGVIPENEIGRLIAVYNKMTLKISVLIEKEYKAKLKRKNQELQKRRLEYQALQSQINPHFLYNTLNAMNTYAMVLGDELLQDMINSLSKMLRYSVQNPLQHVKLSDEFEHVRHYLNIQKHRSKLMPAIETDFNGHLSKCVIRLTLQPLVENVFEHAFPYGVESEHKMTIRAYKQEEFLIIEVADNGIGISDMDIKNIGMGLKNVHRRLQIECGSKYGLLISRPKDGGTSVKLLYPYSLDDSDT